MISKVTGCDKVGDLRSRSFLNLSIQSGITKHHVCIHGDFRCRINLQSLLINSGYAAEVAHGVRDRTMNPIESLPGDKKTDIRPMEELSPIIAIRKILPGVAIDPLTFGRSPETSWDSISAY
jgi:hypothetical protein